MAKQKKKPMFKLNPSEAWYKDMAAKEEGYDISAGIGPSLTVTAKNYPSPEAARAIAKMGPPIQIFSPVKKKKTK